MNSSLCFIAPVHNAADAFPAQVAAALDVLPELTARFEIVVVDDGSTDETTELAFEWAACYPQIRAIRHPGRLGWAECIRTAIAQTTSRIVAWRDERSALSILDLRKLWTSMEEFDAMVGRTAIAQPNWRRKVRSQLSSVGEIPTPAAIEDGADLYLMRRELAERLRWPPEESLSPIVQLLAMRARLHQIVLAETPAIATHQTNGPTAIPARSAEGAPIRRPNYFERIRAFALGE